MELEMFGNSYSISASSVAGRRADNQDSFCWIYSDGNGYVTGNGKPEGRKGCEMFAAAVCDGMGGLSGGAEASRFVTDFITKWSLKGHRGSLEDMCFDFTEAIVSAEKELMSGFEGSGTTLSMVLGVGGRWASLHLGDSRCYTIDGNGKEFRTEDHSPVESMRKAGILDESEMKDHPMKNIISRYLGGGFAEKLEIRELEEWDVLVLCSDGAYGSVSREDFFRYIREMDAEKITGACYESGSRDNITVLRIEKNKP